MATNTTTRTLYRLSGLEPTVEAMLDAFDAAWLDEHGARVHLPETFGVPAVYITCGMEVEEAPWCGSMARTTGIPVVESVRRSAAVLLLAVDGTVYGFGCDQGYRLIPERFKDRRFGLSYVIRQMDPAMIREAVSNSLGQARTDISLVPAGAPVPLLGIRDHSRIIRRLGGYTLVLVKRADGSGPLSHLFSQARVAVELLQESAQARADFAARVAKVARISGGERVLPDDFTPRRIVLAMQLKNRETLTPDSVFGFSQITIAQTAKALAARGVTVEVIGIPAAGA